MTAAAVALALALLEPPAGVDFLLPDGAEPARVRVTVTAGGRSPEVGWRAFLARLFAHFDRDGNGALDRDEAGRVVPLPVPGGEVRADFPRMDADADGSVSPAEFREFYRAAGYAPVVGVVTPPTGRSLEAAEATFAALDRDGDGTLSAKELKAAPDLLRRFDESEDDELTEGELLAGWAGEAAPPKAVVRVTPSEGRPDARIRVGDLPAAVPGGRMLLTADTSPARSLTARELVAEQFTAVGGRADKPVPRAAVEGVRAARALAAVFAPADRDGDGRLTEAELTAYADLVEAGAGCQVALELHDGGRSLFEWLADGRPALTREALERAAALPPLTRAGVPVTYRLTPRQRSPAAAFAGMPLAHPPAAKTPPKEVAKAGPDWFQAMDRNGDGVVTRGEFVGRPERFTALDANGDGRLTAAEAEAASK